MSSVMRFFGRCLVRLFLGVCNCLWVLVFAVAVYSLLFAFAVRGCTMIVSPKPSVDSFDPKLRAAAAEAAGRMYGDNP